MTTFFPERDFEKWRAVLVNVRGGLGYFANIAFFGEGEKNFFRNGSDPLFFCKTNRKKARFGDDLEIGIWSFRNAPWTEICGKWGDFEDQRRTGGGDVVLAAGENGKIMSPEEK